MKIIYRDLAEFETNQKKSQVCVASLLLSHSGFVRIKLVGQLTMVLTMALTPMGSAEFPTNLMFVESKKKLE